MKYIYPKETGASRTGEINDCTVRALSNCTGIDYDVAFDLLKNAGRKNNKGMLTIKYSPAYFEAGAKSMSTYGKFSTYLARHLQDFSVKPCGSASLGKIVKEYPQGRHVVIVTGHAVALVDGKLIDKGFNRSGAHVMAVFHF